MDDRPRCDMNFQPYIFSATMFFFLISCLRDRQSIPRREIRAVQCSAVAFHRPTRLWVWRPFVSFRRRRSATVTAHQNDATGGRLGFLQKLRRCSLLFVLVLGYNGTGSVLFCSERWPACLVVLFVFLLLQSSFLTTHAWVCCLCLPAMPLNWRLINAARLIIIIIIIMCPFQTPSWTNCTNAFYSALKWWMRATYALQVQLD